MGLIDILINSGSAYSVENGVTNDNVTQYNSSWLTGTPNTTANPGPVHNFTQEYSPDIQYANNINSNNSPLIGTNPITNLDVEDPGVQGGPNADIVTQYPSTVTGVPTNTQNPGGPVVNFSQPNLPSNTYLTNNPIQGTGSLSNTLNITNLDVEDPGVTGGIPYKPENDPTIYPPEAKANSSIAGYFPSDGKAASKYGGNDRKVYSPIDTYLNYIKDFL